MNIGRLLGRNGLERIMRPLGRVVLAERFAGTAHLAAVRLPLGGAMDALHRSEAGFLVFLVSAGPAWRGVRLTADMLDGDAAPLGFAPFATAPDDSVSLVVLDAPASAPAELSYAQAAAILRELAGRPRIAVPCNAAVAGFADLCVPVAAPRVMHRISGGHPAEPHHLEAGGTAWAVENAWQEAGDTYLQGWLHAYDAEIMSLSFVRADGGMVPVTEFHARADLLAHYPMLPNGAARVGFSVYLPGFTGPTVQAVVQTGTGRRRAVLRVPPPTPWPEDAAARAANDRAFRWFTDQVNDGGLDVLEIGARIVGPWSESRRRLFPGAGRFIGFDIHAADGVDVVGDAHALSTQVGCSAVDAIFSIAVLEHVAMPWVAAAEMNRALRPGGLTYHVTVQSWPVHEQPNDFWRFTDEALRLLYGNMHGFETIGAGMAQPVRMYPADRAANDPHLPFSPGYGLAWVLARKVAELPDAGPFAAGAPGLAELSRRYPAPS